MVDYVYAVDKDCSTKVFSDSLACAARLVNAVYTNITDTDSWRGKCNVTQLNEELGDPSGRAAYDFIMTGR